MLLVSPIRNVLVTDLSPQCGHIFCKLTWCGLGSADKLTRDVFLIMYFLIAIMTSIYSLSDYPVTSYAQYLKIRYEEPLPDDEKLFINNIGEIYIELAVISTKNISHEQADDFKRMNIRGQTDNILQTKTLVTLEDILKPGENGRPVRRVLMEGAPGAGKSRLAWELCHKWANDSLKQYKLVVLVELRGKIAQEVKCLNDLFPLSENNNIKKVMAAIGDGEGVLIILDGFDELPDSERQKKKSVYIDLIKRKKLPEATVLITSRPSVSAYLMKYPIDRRLEILGFTEARIEDYARSVYSDPKALDDFLKYINGNPFIKGMMYLPLNAVFVASIFEYHHRTDIPFPKTMTQLYDAVTRSLIRRHLVDKKLEAADYTMPIQTLQCMEDIKRLPNPVPDQLLELARIAFEGLLNEKYVFTADPGNELFDHLGMMKKTISLDDPAKGPTYTFQFLHLTLQEYLSALHMSLVLSPTQLYDALIRRLIRSHIMVNKLVPADYLMPRTLQSREDINRLPRAIADQLLVIAKIAYEGVRDKRSWYKFTDLTISQNEFVHFGMVKKIRHTDDDYDDPTFTSGLVFLHTTLQEYLSVLYISLEPSLTNERNIRPLYWHSDLGLPLPSDNRDIVLRFLAGLCKHSSSFSCKQVGDLAANLHQNPVTKFSLQVPRCVYESNSIVQENQRIQKMLSSKKIINVNVRVGLFDYYLIGHCICHHGGMWSIASNKKEETDLLVQGLKSCGDSPRGKLQRLAVTNVGLLELDPLLVRDLQQVYFLEVTFTANSVNMIRKCISPDAALKEVNIFDCEHVEQLFPVVFDESSLDILLIIDNQNTLHISDDAMKLLMNNSNLKYLYLHFPLKLPAHTVCDNTSLDYLANLLVMFIESYHTPPIIETSYKSSEFDVMFNFKKDTTGSGKPLVEFTIILDKSCDYYKITEQILERIPEQYHNSLP